MEYCIFAQHPAQFEANKPNWAEDRRLTKHPTFYEVK